LQASAVRRVVVAMCERGFDTTRFDKVFLAGRSLGAAVGLIAAGTYRSVDGVVITGWAHGLNPLGAPGVFASLHPAALDPTFGAPSLDLGYLTTRPGVRAVFHEPGQVVSNVIATDERTKDAFAATEAPDAVALGLASPYSARLRAPSSS
jgi:pimeloyl-ACP methyl ester carboxylesterase